MSIFTIRILKLNFQSNYIFLREELVVKISIFCEDFLNFFCDNYHFCVNVLVNSYNNA